MFKNTIKKAAKYAKQYAAQHNLTNTSCSYGGTPVPAGTQFQLTINSNTGRLSKKIVGESSAVHSKLFTKYGKQISKSVIDRISIPDTYAAIIHGVITHDNIVIVAVTVENNSSAFALVSSEVENIVNALPKELNAANGSAPALVTNIDFVNQPATEWFDFSKVSPTLWIPLPTDANGSVVRVDDLAFVY